MLRSFQSGLVIALFGTLPLSLSVQGAGFEGPQGGTCVGNKVARFLAKISREEAPLLMGGPPESGALKRRGLVLRGNYSVQVKGVDADAGILRLAPKDGLAVKLGADEYLEFPNSAATQTHNPIDGSINELLLPRAVRAYENEVDLNNGSQSPQDYVSDVPLMKEWAPGKFEFKRMILRSAPEKGFLFEDPRISKIADDQGREKIFLSGTDYSPHTPGSRNADVMNRYVELELDFEGLPKEVSVNATTGMPAFKNLSPAPFKAPDGSWVYVDAKNATLTRNSSNHVLVDTRLRPDFGNAYVRELFGDLSWKYALQTFEFESLSDLEAYDWRWSLIDLAQPGNQEGPVGRVRPLWSKVHLTNKQMPQLFHDPRVLQAKSGGVGWGSQAMWIQRQGDELWFSEQPGMPLKRAGKIKSSLLANHRLNNGEGELWNLSHSILYFNEAGFDVRHYSTLLMVRDGTGRSVKAVYDKVSQPLRDYERGIRSGIVDLQHTYPMGRTLSIEDGRGTIRSYEGTSDAHTARKDYDIMKLDEELHSGSERWSSGQIFKP